MKEIRIAVVDNGALYSDHRLYFLTLASSKDKTSLQRLVALVNVDSTYFPHKIIGVGQFDWFEGKLVSILDYFKLHDHRIPEVWDDGFDKAKMLAADLPPEFRKYLPSGY